MQSHPSFCRICAHACPILVDVEDGRAIRVKGDPANDLYQGYTCVKGRAQPEFLSSPDRLLHSVRRTADGSFQPVPADAAIDDIARRIAAVVDEHGPRSVALYTGTMGGTHPATSRMAHAFMRAIGSPMLFNPSTIDKPGKLIAPTLHGRWMAPHQEFDRPDAALLIGVNPLVSYGGLPKGHQARWLRAAQDRGMKLIVIDPRRSDIARRADLFLQPRPGHDIELVACIIRTIIGDGLHDATFVADNVAGFEALTRTVEPFDIDTVARIADVDAADLAEVARVYGAAGRGYSMAGTGPSMSKAMHGTLLEYLMLSLEAVCGHYLKAGERVRNPGALVPTRAAVAQAKGPWAVPGEPLRVRDLTTMAAGCPTAALADEILLDGPGQVKVLISAGGNPVAAWPDETKTIEALRSLDLLVQLDPWMSQTARLADYVIAPTMPLEMPGTTLAVDVIASFTGPGYGVEDAFAQYSPAIVDTPEGSEVIADWTFFYRLAQRMGLALDLGGAALDAGTSPTALDMVTPPTSEDLLELVSAGSRIPLAEVKQHPHGALFPEPAVVVARKQPGWEERLDVGNELLLDELEEVGRSLETTDQSSDDESLPFRLICRRMQHMYNSSCNDPATNHGRPYNPAFMHPDDLEHLDLSAGDVVEIVSGRATILGVVAADASLRRGLVSMTHAFGDLPDEGGDVRAVGSNVDRLLHNDRDYDRYSGQPPMSNIAVAVRPREGN